MAQGFTQNKGVNYKENLLLVAMLKSIKILFSIAPSLDYKFWKMDIKMEFLNCYLKENIYMV